MMKWYLPLECMVGSTFKYKPAYFTTRYREITGFHPVTFVVITTIGADIWSTT